MNTKKKSVFPTANRGTNSHNRGVIKNDYCMPTQAPIGSIQSTPSLEDVTLPFSPLQTFHPFSKRKNCCSHVDNSASQFQHV